MLFYPYHGDGVDLVFVPNLVGRVLQLLLVPAHQDDVEAGLGEGQGVLLSNTLNSQGSVSRRVGLC